MSSKIFNQVKRISIWLSITIFLLYCLVWAVSSPTIKYFLNTPLAQHKLTLSSDSQFIYNPFLTRLSIKDVTINNEAGRVFALKKLDLQVSLYQLVFDDLVIQEFNVEELFIKTDISSDDMVVAGVSINRLSELNANTEVTDKKEENTAETNTSKLIRVLLSKLSLSQSEIVATVNGEGHHFTFNQLNVENIDVTAVSQRFNLSLDGKLDSADIVVTADVDMTDKSGVIHSQVSLKDYQLEHVNALIPQLDKLSGLFNLRTEQTLTLENDKVTINVEQASLGLKNSVIAQQETILELENYTTNFEAVTLVAEPSGGVNISGFAQVHFTNGQLLIGDESEELFSFENIALDNIQLSLNKDVITPANDALKVIINRLVVDNISASKKAKEALPAISKLGQFSMKDISLTQNGVSVDKVIIDSLDSHIILDKDKKIANLIQLPQANNNKGSVDAGEESTTTSPSETTVPEDKTPEFQFAVNSVELLNSNQLVFTDNSVDPVYTRTIFIDKFIMGALNSQDKIRQTPFELIGRSDKYTQFAFDGFVQPLIAQPTYRIKGKLNELSLPGVSTYMKDALQFELLSGQLDSNVDLTITGDKMDGKISVVIRGLETSAADDHEADSLKDQVAIPLNVALGMLKNNDGVIKLDLPFSGLAQGAHSGISSIIALVTKRAAMSATQSYLMKTFVPYANVLSVAMSAGEFLLKVRFEDLLYEDKQINLSDEQENYAQQFILLMKDKPETEVKVCAISTPLEIGLELGSKVTDKADIKRLKEIATQRGQAFKDYVVEHSDVKSSRILLCAPQIDSSKKAKAKIHISV